jgi:hypothetical protein
MKDSAILQILSAFETGSQIEYSGLCRTASGSFGTDNKK